MARTINAAVGMACLLVTLIIPLVALILTPGDTAAIYNTIYKGFGTELPLATQRLLGFSKVLLILGWLLLNVVQAAGVFLGQRRSWISIIQFVMAVPAVVFFVAWHLITVHLPTIKLMNDLS